MAVSLTADALGRALSVNDATAVRLLPVAVALVERFAPAAPDVIQNEAAIRCAGWLIEAPAGPFQSEATGDVRSGFDGSRALRHSGAMGLLSPWKVRRAGAIS